MITVYIFYMFRVVALADDLFELLDGKSLVEVDRVEVGAVVDEERLRLAAGGAGSFFVELQFHVLDP